jgi:dTDP-4-amino-4,6-dideoxygalactose transaminase
VRVPYVDLAGQYAADRQALLKALDAVLAGGHYILGRQGERFERALARRCGTRHAVGVANGTDALVLTLKALGIGRGDEVVTAPNSFVASAACVALVGATPVFADVRPDQLLDPAKLGGALTRRTKAIIPVHLTGKVCDMEAIGRFARAHGLFVVEDAAQAVGALRHGRAAGSFGDAGCLSFHPLKNVNAAGDAGAVVTDDAALAARIRLLRNHGLRARDDVAVWGHNSRLDALQAAILGRRLAGLDAVVAARRRNAARYREGLADLVLCPQDDPGCRDTYHLYAIQADRRDALQASLRAAGIGTAVHYPIPIHLQPPARKLGYRRGDFPECERQAKRVLSLPVHQGLRREQLAHVVQRIRRFYRA